MYSLTFRVNIWLAWLVMMLVGLLLVLGDQVAWAQARGALDPSGRWTLHGRADGYELRSRDGRQRRGLSRKEVEQGGSLLDPPALSGPAVLSLTEIADLPASRTILTGAVPTDLDDDGNFELILTESDPWSQTLWVYESTADDSFDLAHTLTVPGSASTVSIYPTELTDGDGDGLEEILIYGRTLNDFWIRTYEQTSPGSYPTAATFEMVPLSNWWASGAEIDDLDADRIQELSYSQQINTGYFQINENTGNDSYTEVYNIQLGLPSGAGIQAYTAGLDLNGNCRLEILMGGLDGLFLFENVADDSYSLIWHSDLGINIDQLIDTKDIDQDGLPDFLVVGFGTYESVFGAHFLLLEAGGPEGFQVVWQHSDATGLFGDGAAVIGDLDSDGAREIITQVVDTTSNDLIVFEQTGDNSFSPAWTHNTTKPSNVALHDTLGTGDLDRDGRMELYFNDDTGLGVRTLVFESTGDPGFIPLNPSADTTLFTTLSTAPTFAWTGGSFQVFGLLFFAPIGGSHQVVPNPPPHWLLQTTVDLSTVDPNLWDTIDECTPAGWMLIGAEPEQSPKFLGPFFFRKSKPSALSP